MPLLNSYLVNENCIWGLWKIAESEEDLYYSLEENIDREELTTLIHPKRRIEWLAARALAKVLIGQMSGNLPNEFFICKDEYGKPFIKNSDWQISFSHCSLYAVAILHKTQAVGIDIEQVSPRISRVIRRICTKEELAWAGDSLAKLTTLWCSKEALYKYYGKKKLDFRKEIMVSKNANKGRISTNEGIKEMALVNVSSLENYQIVYCLAV